TAAGKAAALHADERKRNARKTSRPRLYLPPWIRLGTERQRDPNVLRLRFPDEDRSASTHRVRASPAHRASLPMVLRLVANRAEGWRKLQVRRGDLHPSTGRTGVGHHDRRRRRPATIRVPVADRVGRDPRRLRARGWPGRDRPPPRDA